MLFTHTASALSQDLVLERAILSERLFDGVSRRCLSALGLEPGWRCLELGSGQDSIARWLAQQVTSSGDVVLMGDDPGRLHPEPIPDNLEIRVSGIDALDREAAAYDLVHSCDLLASMDRPKDALRQLAAAVRPGGWLCIQEYDFSAFGALEAEHPAGVEFDLASRVCFEAPSARGGVDARYGRRLPGLMRGLRFANWGVSAELFIGEGGDHPLGQWCASRVGSHPFDERAAQGAVVAQAVAEAVARIHEFLDTPGFGFVGPVLVSTWGQRPFF